MPDEGEKEELETDPLRGEAQGFKECGQQEKESKEGLDTSPLAGAAQDLVKREQQEEAEHVG